MTKIKLLAITGVFLMTSCQHVPSANAPVDPFIHLEEIESKASLAWVAEQNKKSAQVFESDPRLAKLQAELKVILTDDSRIPHPSLTTNFVYNFWKDAKNPRGLWRRTSWDEYRKQKSPTWETILDIDQLKAKEKEEWVWKGSSCLLPDGDHCMVFLSKGGKDSFVAREFNLKTRSFVKGGFEIPEAKTFLTWVDADTLLLATNFGQETLSGAGYPLQVRLLKRGQKLNEAKLVFSGQPADLTVGPGTILTPKGLVHTVARYPKFFESEIFELNVQDGKLTPIERPIDSDLVGYFDESWILKLRSDWTTGDQKFVSGSVVAAPRAGAKKLIWKPTETTSLRELTVARDALYLIVSENVQDQLLRSLGAMADWRTERVLLPEAGVIDLGGSRSDIASVFVTFESPLQPETQYEVDGARAKPRQTRAARELFNAKNLVVEQKWATSRDGTKVPYFIVRSKDLKPSGENPTLLNAYGGFSISSTPSYRAKIGKGWLEKGGVYVLANIRGGGEFGPRWHQAALRENRQRAFDDFYAVAEDLIKTKVTSPKRLGIMGGSNGGLLVGTAMTQRPELFNAVICQVPLLDMLRFDQLLTGKFWVEEYGSPADPQARKWIEAYSPYQNVRAGQKYPEPFIITSTKDDRVHPGHARKMVAKLQSLGYPVLYYENMLGGHGADADFNDEARRTAFEYVYLMKKLMD